MDNKEYIINIRVSKETYSKLKNKARENGDSLSNLVRKALDDGQEIFSDLKKDLFETKSEKAGGVDYFQRVILAKDSECSLCGVSISRGEQMYVGETKTGAKKYFCNKCFLEN